MSAAALLLLGVWAYGLLSGVMLAASWHAFVNPTPGRHRRH